MLHALRDRGSRMLDSLRNRSGCVLDGLCDWGSCVLHGLRHARHTTKRTGSADLGCEKDGDQRPTRSNEQRMLLARCALIRGDSPLGNPQPVP